MIADALARSLTSRGSGKGSWLWEIFRRMLFANTGCVPKCWITTASQSRSTRLFFARPGWVWNALTCIQICQPGPRWARPFVLTPADFASVGWNHGTEFSRQLLPK